MSLRFQKDGGAKSKQSWTNLSHWNTGGSSNRYEELLGSLNNHDNDAGYNAKKKMNLYFMNEIRSCLDLFGSLMALKTCSS